MAVHDFTNRLNEQKAQLSLETINIFEKSPFLDNDIIPGDNRAYPRKEYKLPVSLAHKGRLRSGTSLNLSYSGIFIRTSDTAYYNENDLLTLTFVTSNDFPLILKGKIARKDETGIGVRFLNH